MAMASALNNAEGRFPPCPKGAPHGPWCSVGALRPSKSLWQSTEAQQCYSFWVEIPTVSSQLGDQRRPSGRRPTTSSNE